MKLQLQSEKKSKAKVWQKPEVQPGLSAKTLSALPYEKTVPKKFYIVLLTALSKTIAVIFVVILALLIFLYGAMALVVHGPSPYAKELFVTTCMETSFAKYFPPMYLSDEEIDGIIAENAVVELEEVTETDSDFSDNSADASNKDQPDIEVIEVSGTTFKGQALLVKDPSRVVLESPPSFGADSSGEKLIDMIKKVDGVAGINAGGFVDDSGVGNGGIPTGIVIKNSQIMYGADDSGVVVGFDDKNVLRVGSMTAKKAKELNLRDAVSFGPALVVNGKAAPISGRGGGLNPRSAIGQREDGTVILLTVDGRQPHSLGATYGDMVDLMIELKAVNAGNLDGGSSTMMYYNNELINQCASLYGPRKIATGFIVK